MAYSIGDVFAVPLVDGGYGLGLIIRFKRGMILAYFFDGVYEVPPRLDEIALRHADVIKIDRFGDRRLKDGGWPIPGLLPDWSPDDWPIPLIVGWVPPDRPNRRIRAIDPDNIYRSRDMQIVPREEVVGFPEDSFSNWRGPEIYLNRLLHHTPRPLPRVTIVAGPKVLEPKPPPAPPVVGLRFDFEIPSSGLSKKKMKIFDQLMEYFPDMLYGGFVDRIDRTEEQCVVFAYGRDEKRMRDSVMKFLTMASPILPKSVTVIPVPPEVVARRIQPQPDPEPEEGLHVHFTLPDSGLNAKQALRFELIEDQMHTLLKTTGVGYVDGIERGGNDVTLFLYGANSERLWAEAKAFLAKKSPVQPDSVTFLSADPDEEPRTVALN